MSTAILEERIATMEVANIERGQEIAVMGEKLQWIYDHTRNVEGMLNTVVAQNNQALAQSAQALEQSAQALEQSAQALALGNQTLALGNRTLGLFERVLIGMQQQDERFNASIGDLAKRVDRTEVKVDRLGERVDTLSQDLGTTNRNVTAMAVTLKAVADKVGVTA